MLKKFSNYFKKITNIEKIFYVFLIFVIIMVITNTGKDFKEGFDQKNRGEFKINNTIKEIYNEKYVSIYDDLVFSRPRSIFEITSIINDYAPSKTNYVLDVGSGTGHTVAALNMNGVKAMGVDKSEAMVSLSKKEYPKYEFIAADIMNPMLFDSNSFSHISCLYFTIYYISDKRQFFKNCYNWLKPNGKLVLHLVDRKKFNPIIPAGDPFHVVSPQSYTDKRLIKTNVKFDQFDYISEFKDSDNDITLFEEIFKYKNGKVEKNIHKFYMPSQKYILSLAKDAGFIFLSKTEMNHINYDNQYIYVLTKSG